MCPDCGLSAKLNGSAVKVASENGKCEHRQNPLACPVLMLLISVILARPKRVAKGGGALR